MSVQTRVFETIGNMIQSHVPGSTEEDQLIHLIDASGHIHRHGCSFSEALSATAKRSTREVLDLKYQLNHLTRAKAYRRSNGGTWVEALRKTARMSGTSQACLEIAGQLDLIEEAKKHQMEHQHWTGDFLSVAL